MVLLRTVFRFRCVYLKYVFFCKMCILVFETNSLEAKVTVTTVYLLHIVIHVSHLLTW